MGLAALGVAVVAVACCAALPLVVGVIGGLALASKLGIAAGGLVLVLPAVLGLLRSRRNLSDGSAATRGPTT